MFAVTAITIVTEWRAVNSKLCSSSARNTQSLFRVLWYLFVSDSPSWFSKQFIDTLAGDWCITWSTPWQCLATPPRLGFSLGARKILLLSLCVTRTRVVSDDISGPDFSLCLMFMLLVGPPLSHPALSLGAALAHGMLANVVQTEAWKSAGTSLLLLFPLSSSCSACWSRRGMRGTQSRVEWTSRAHPESANPSVRQGAPSRQTPGEEMPIGNWSSQAGRRRSFLVVDFSRRKILQFLSFNILMFQIGLMFERERRRQLTRSQECQPDFQLLEGCRYLVSVGK